MRWLLSLLFVSASAFGQTLVLTHVNVVDVAGGGTHADRTVVIRDGVIAQVASRAAPPKDARVIDARGQYLLPGLWDMHTHVAGISADPAWGKRLLPAYLAYGVTGIRDMAGDVDSLLAWKREQAEGKLIGPRMIVCGPFVDGSTQGFTFPGDVTEARTPEAGRAAVRQLKQRGVDFIKVGSQLSRETFLAVADESRRQRLPFVGHVPDAVTPAEASRAGMKSQEHLFGVALAVAAKSDELRARIAEARAKKDTPTYVALVAQAQQTTDAARAGELFAEFKRNGTWIVPTLAWTEVASTLAQRSDDPLLKLLPEDLQKKWAPGQTIMSEGAQRYYGRKLASDMKLIGMMNTAGVSLLAGTDSLDPYVFPGETLHLELELLVKAGLTPLQALQAATVSPARFLGMERTLGTVAAGKTADLVLLEADPLADIRNTRRIVAVIQRGKYFSRADLDHMLAPR